MAQTSREGPKDRQEDVFLETGVPHAFDVERLLGLASAYRGSIV
jgi:hypothetical protein